MSWLRRWGCRHGILIQIVKHYGGQVIAQDEASSAVFQMPRSAIATGDVDQVLPLEQIAPALAAQVAALMHGTSSDGER